MTDPADNRPIIVWVGRHLDHDGYGTAARRHVAALRSAGAPVVAIDLPSRSAVGPVDDQLVRLDRVGVELRVTSRNPERHLAVVVHDRPDRFPNVAATGRARTIGHSYWEANALPERWSSWMASMDRVWTASTFNRDVFVRGGVPDWMIDVVAVPVSETAVAVGRSRTGLRARWHERTVFLTVVTTPLGRRDLGSLIESYSQAFDDTDSVALVVKAPPDGAAEVRDTVGRVVRSMPERDPDRSPTIHVIAEQLSDEEMLRLHASADAFVSCERGDGWNIPAMDSLTVGVPVVAADFGGSAAFIRSDDSYVVPTTAGAVPCDGVLRRRHALYSGQTWAYVDPVVVAATLRSVHEGPADLHRRGQRAAERVQREFSPAVVAEQLIELTATIEHVDYRSNLPALVRMRPTADAWRIADWVARQNTNLALQTDLRDGDQLLPRSSRSLVGATARAVYRTTLRPGVADAVRTLRTRPVAAPRAALRAVRPTWSEARRLRSVVDLGDLSGYIGAVSGAAVGAESPEELEVRRRRLESKFGPIRSPEHDLRRLSQLRNRHHGERIFILGNGPSLVKHDLSRLAGEFTFGVNKIHLLFDIIDWRPTFYTLLDWKMGAAVRDHIHRYEGVAKFFPERFRGVLPADDETYWYWVRPVGQHVDDQFETDMTCGLPSRGTVLVTAIQQAFHLGFREIILIGVDASYAIPSTVQQTGPDQFGTGTRLHLTSTADDDPNHFSPAYFGAGARWHDPNVVDMRRMFRLMRKGVERSGGRLVNATDGGELEVLERVGFDSLFS